MAEVILRGLRKEKDTRASHSMGINMFMAALFKGDRPLFFQCVFLVRGGLGFKGFCSFFCWGVWVGGREGKGVGKF